MSKELDEHIHGLWKLFSQRMDESGNGRSEVPSFLIYHYTTAAGVRGILEGKHIYATNFRYLNDLSEMKYGREVSDEFLRARLEEERRPLQDELEHFLSESPDNAMERNASMMHEKGKAFLLINEAVRLFRYDDMKVPYISSFCESGDLLSQWRGYANRGGGYAIGIAVKASPLVSDEGSFHVFKVLYDHVEQRKLLDTILADAIKAFDDFPFSMANKSEYDLVIGKHVGTLLQYFDLICMRFKDDAFSEEHEWRFFAGIDADSLDFVKFRDVNGLVIPYLELPITAEGIEIKRIVCGPTLHPELSRHSVEMLARKNGFSNVEVVNSRIPLGAF